MFNGSSHISIGINWIFLYRFPWSYFWSTSDCSDKTDIPSFWRSILCLSTTWVVRNELRLRNNENDENLFHHTEFAGVFKDFRIILDRRNGESFENLSQIDQMFGKNFHFVFTDGKHTRSQIHKMFPQQAIHEQLEMRSEIIESNHESSQSLWHFDQTYFRSRG